MARTFDRLSHHSAKAVAYGAFNMVSFDNIPNELLQPIVEAVVGDLRHRSFADLLAFALTCNRFHSAAMPVLYASAALRHPYLLIWAAETGNLRVLTRLLQAGLDPNTQFNFLVESKSWIGMVFFCGYVPPADNPRKLLWDHWMVPDESIFGSSRYLKGGYTSLFAFCSDSQAKRRCDVLQYAIWRPGEPGFVDEWNRTVICSPVFPLHFAAANGHVDAIRLLIQAGAIPDVPSSAPWGLLFRTDLTADPDEPLGMGHEATPLRVALFSGQDEAFWELRAHGAALLDYGTRCDAVLQYTVERGRHDIVARLMDDTVLTAAEANRKDPLLNRSLLWTACQVSNIPVVRRLAALGANLDEDFGTGYTPLFDACLFRRVELARELLRLGSSRDIVFRGPYGANLHSFESAGLDIRGFSPVDIYAWLMQPPDDRTLDAAKYWDNPLGREPVTLEELKAVGRELAEAFQETGVDIEPSVSRVAAWHDARSGRR